MSVHLAYFPPSFLPWLQRDILGDIINFEGLQNRPSRLAFATSVFHAYAHNMACQTQYNPRLIEKFGLANGEGCERLWSELRSLIPINRGAGKSRRLVHIARRVSTINSTRVASFGK